MCSGGAQLSRSPHPLLESPLPNPCASLLWQRCELCPHKDGALKRTDNGGEGGPEPKSSSVEVSRAPEWDLGRRSGLLWGGQGEAGGWVFLPLLALESDGKAVGGGDCVLCGAVRCQGLRPAPHCPRLGPRGVCPLHPGGAVRQCAHHGAHRAAVRAS